ncbi:DoxX family protein [Dyadobacter flavalbus]|uniref:DoxX family protein n=1 Tax=Dyadobacter flavalbus TaxID=2579942 RepID=A0A5M8QV78_9BACT|nr:DoxX family protein [Dyadobacter flavalbus]KAA6440167.1 DoxX family protein [Dyadobacter flavalbus]
MNMIDRIEHWGDTHHPAYMDALRVVLGILLFGKGVSFISDTGNLTRLLHSLNIDLWSVMAVHYVAFSHIFGGFLIAIGCYTRTASIFQIPILLVAVFFVNIRAGFSYLNSELWLSMLTLVLVITFSIIGSGRYSTDEWMRKHDR